MDKLEKYEDEHNKKNELLELQKKEILKDFSIDELNAKKNELEKEKNKGFFARLFGK